MAKNGVFKTIDELRTLIDSLEENIPGRYYTGRAKGFPSDGIDLLKRETLEGLDLVEIIERKIEELEAG